jgi:hypothetical protein
MFFDYPLLYTYDVALLGYIDNLGISVRKLKAQWSLPARDLEKHSHPILCLQARFWQAGAS